MIAVLPSISGLSWLGVLSILSPPRSTINHAHPEPKRPTPAAANCSLNLSKLPKALSIA
jgi:hypothetical protein